MPVPTMPAYTMPEHCFSSLSGLRCPMSCGVRGRGTGRSSNRSLTPSEIKKGLPSSTSECKKSGLSSNP